MDGEKKYEASISAHYGRSDLSEEIFGALEKAGRKITSYKDATTFDQFHMRGQDATRELAHLADLKTGERVLDLGCGIGGAARLLAAEFGCRATGVDLVEEFVRTAAELTRKAGLSDRVDFHAGNMLNLPFEENLFDAVWSQHTFMNIEDKPRLLLQIHRVLRPHGRLALYEVAQGQNLPVYYPVQWASDPSISFLLPLDPFKHMIVDAGFELLHWQDVTEECLQWFQSIVTKMKHRPAGAPPPLGVNLLIGPTAAEKARNTVRNLQEGRIRVVYGVFEKRW
ncbi:MAG: class I SAM-dependent methyltransferase [Desulfobacteraceae bacterium]|nr:MAG: class I SAM-dependent methyltransferase [Desulfobacteraceae bacterium]